MAKHTCSFFRSPRWALLAASLAALPVLAEEAEEAAPMAAAEAAPAIAPDIRRELLRELPAADIRWLEAESGRFPVLLRKEVLGDSRGGVILLHGYQRNLNWPEVIAPLRELLSEGGWYTVSVPLPPDPPRQNLAPPEPDPMRPPKAPDATPDAAGGAGTAENPDAGTADAAGEPADYRGIVAQRVTAAVKLLNGEGQFNVALLGYEAGANWALDHFKGQVRDSLAGLVMIDARNRVQGLANREWFLDLLVDEQRPVLDMSGPAEDLQADAARRAGVARRAQLPAYRSMRRMNAEGGVRSDDPDLVRVRAWLEKNVRRELVRGK